MHFSVIITLPVDILPDREVMEEAIEAVMKPYDENLEVEPRSTKGDRWVKSRDEQLASMARTRQAVSDGEQGYDQEYWTAWAQKYDSGLSQDELLKDWDGTTAWDDEGWPISTSNPRGEWDYYRIGGRWTDSWVLKEGAENGPFPREQHWDGPKPPDHDRQTTDCARIGNIEAESLKPSFAYVDEAGEWHTRERWTPKVNGTERDWDYSTIPDEEWFPQIMKWLAQLHPDTWIICLDCHS